MYFTPRASNERWNKQEIKNSNCVRIKEEIKDCKKEIIFWSEILGKDGADLTTKIYAQSEILRRQEMIIVLEQDLQKYN